MTAKLRDNSKGFGIIELLIILLVVGLLGLGGWYVCHSRVKASKGQTTSNESKRAGVEQAIPRQKLDKKYTDLTGHFSVMYPATWRVQTETSDGGGADLPTTTTTITSPTGAVLNLNSDWGGRGGVCEPATTDKPFMAGNQCPSREYLSSEALPVKSVYYPSEERDGSGKTTYKPKPSTIVLVTSHFAYPAGESWYLVGLTQSDPPYFVTVNEPVMGYLRAENFFAVYDASRKFHPYIYAYATGSDEAFLQSEDVGTIKSILRTMTVDL